MFIERVRVIGKRFFEQVFRREDFVEVEQLLIVAVFCGGAENVEPEMGAGQRGQFFFKKRRGDFFVKPIGVARTEAFFVPVGVLFQQGSIAVNVSLEVGGIKDEPFLHVGDNQAFDVAIARLLALIEVVAEQFVEGFCVGFVGVHHLGAVAGLFGFDDDSDGVFGGFARADSEVLPLAGVDVMLVAVPDVFEKIGDDVFEMFFGFAGGMFDALEQPREFGFEAFELAALHVADAVGGQERFGNRERVEFHRFRSVFLRASIATFFLTQSR